MNVETLRVSNHAYREQLKTATLQLNLGFLVSINETFCLDVFSDINQEPASVLALDNDIVEIEFYEDGYYCPRTL